VCEKIALRIWCKTNHFILSRFKKDIFLYKMSFRVKSTHKSLNLDPPEKKVESAMSFFNAEDKVSFLTATTSVSATPSTKEQRPTRSSEGGMAVRSVAVAQADHM
jgi:hypothetical protein